MGQKVFKDKTSLLEDPSEPKEGSSETKIVETLTDVAVTTEIQRDSESLQGAVVEEERDMSDYTAASPPNIIPSTMSIFDNKESSIDIKLMPHQHTLFCERKVQIMMPLHVGNNISSRSVCVELLVKSRKWKY